MPWNQWELVSPSWEAVATLIAGASAVFAAWRIGTKQTEIQQFQIKLTETNLRIQLLERRRECINKMREVHSEWMRDARISTERWNQFRDVFFEAELLFSKQLVEEIDSTLGALFMTEHLQRRARHYHERDQAEKANEKLEESFAEDDKVFELMPNLLSKLKEQTRVAEWD